MSEALAILENETAKEFLRRQAADKWREHRSHMGKEWRHTEHPLWSFWYYKNPDQTTTVSAYDTSQRYWVGAGKIPAGLSDEQVLAQAKALADQFYAKLTRYIRKSWEGPA